MKNLLSVSFSLAALPTLAAQDMVAVDFAGQVYSLDSYSAVAKRIGTGLFGQDATAMVAGGVVWSTHRAGSSPNLVYSLTTVDPKTGVAKVAYSGVPDIRAMAGEGKSTLWCIVNGNYDELHRVDTTTGKFTKIGNSTGRKGLEGLAVHQGQLFGWCTSGGLMIIDRTTGRATDVDPKTGGGGGSLIHFLASRADGMLVGGMSDLYEIDPATGAYKRIGSLGSGMNLRGAEEWFGTARPFGVGCAGKTGTVVLGVTGSLHPSGLLTASSTNHAANSIGAMVIGVSRTADGSVPLPLDLDPMLGTRGCSLWVSMDVLIFGRAAATPSAPLSFGIVLPPSAAGQVAHLQHATFEAVPGGMSWSNGVTVHVGY